MKTTTERLECSICMKTFSTSGHLTRHSKIHTGEKKWECAIEGCFVRFSRKDNLQCHFNSHRKKLAAAGRPMILKKNATIPEKKAKKAPTPIETSETAQTTDLKTSPKSETSRQRSFSFASNSATELVYSNPEHQRNLSSLSFASEFLAPLDISRTRTFSFASETVSPIDIPHARAMLFDSEFPSPVDKSQNHESKSQTFSFASETMQPDDNQSHSRCFSFASQLVSPAETACNEESFGFFSSIVSPINGNNDQPFSFDNLYRERTISFASELPADEKYEQHSRRFSYASELPTTDDNQSYSRCQSFGSELPLDDNQSFSRCLSFGTEGNDQQQPNYFSFASQLPTPEGDNADAFQEKSISQLSALTFGTTLNNSVLSPTGSVNTPYTGNEFSFESKLCSPQSELVNELGVNPRSVDFSVNDNDRLDFPVIPSFANTLL